MIGDGVVFEFDGPVVSESFLHFVVDLAGVFGFCVYPEGTAWNLAIDNCAVFDDDCAVFDGPSCVGEGFEVGGQAVLGEDNYNTQLLGSQNDMATIRLR